MNLKEIHSTIIYDWYIKDIIYTLFKKKLIFHSVF